MRLRGNPNSSRCEESRLAPSAEKHEVRCCSDTEKAGYFKRNGCSVWAGSKFSTIGAGNAGCAHNKTLAEAIAICQKENARLCTANEITNKCTIGTGCGHDRDMIWTSSAVLISTQAAARAGQAVRAGQAIRAGQAAQVDSPMTAAECVHAKRLFDKIGDNVQPSDTNRHR